MGNLRVAFDFDKNITQLVVLFKCEVTDVLSTRAHLAEFFAEGFHANDAMRVKVCQLEGDVSDDALKRRLMSSTIVMRMGDRSFHYASAKLGEVASLLHIILIETDAEGTILVEFVKCEGC